MLLVPPLFLFRTPANDDYIAVAAAVAVAVALANGCISRLNSLAAAVSLSLNHPMMTVWYVFMTSYAAPRCNLLSPTPFAIQYAAATVIAER